MEAARVDTLLIPQCTGWVLVIHSLSLVTSHKHKIHSFTAWKWSKTVFCISESVIDKDDFTDFVVYNFAIPFQTM